MTLILNEIDGDGETSSMFGKLLSSGIAMRRIGFENSGEVFSNCNFIGL